MGAIANDWLVPLSAEFKKPYYASLYKKVVEEYTTHVVYPPSDEIFTAFYLTPLSKVKVVILGQDPYHEPGQAHGLLPKNPRYADKGLGCADSMIRCFEL